MAVGTQAVRQVQLRARGWLEELETREDSELVALGTQTLCPESFGGKATKLGRKQQLGPGP